VFRALRGIFVLFCFYYADEYLNVATNHHHHAEAAEQLEKGQTTLGMFLKTFLFILFTNIVYRYKNLRQPQYRCPGTKKGPNDCLYRRLGFR